MSSQAESISAWKMFLDWQSMVAAFRVQRQSLASRSAALRKMAARSCEGHGRPGAARGQRGLHGGAGLGRAAHVVAAQDLALVVGAAAFGGLLGADFLGADVEGDVGLVGFHVGQAGLEGFALGAARARSRGWVR